MPNENLSAKRFDFSKTESQAFIVHTVRLVFLLLVLLFAVSFQYLETRIEASDVFYPLYVLIALTFAIHVLYLAFFKKLYSNTWVTSALFYYEAFYVTGLIYFIGVQQSILIFLYLVNLILGGVLFQRRGALLLALWTSVLFSFIVSLDTSLSGNTAYLAVGVNNLAFFTVAYLSGFLSEQLNVMGVQLKEKARDVQALKNLNDLILNSIHSGLLTVDSKGLVLKSNPAARTILGFEQSSGGAAHSTDWLPSLDISSAPYDKEFDLNFKRGNEKRLLSVTINHLIDEVGQTQGSIISFRDQTLVRQLEKQLRQSEKMAAIGQLAAGIAHEIRNPLAGISGSIQLMQADRSDAEQFEKLMRIVSREIDRLNNLITEFLDFAKPEAPMEDHVNIGSLVSDLVEFTARDKSFENIDLQRHIDDSLVILGNKDKLRQAFLNIVVNAFQALEGRDNPQVSIDVKRLGRQAVVCIRDNGVGMSHEMIDRIFEPFHTTKHKGTGLGLAITHSIVESHGGEIQVESQKDKGTEFRLSFQTINSI